MASMLPAAAGAAALVNQARGGGNRPAPPPGMRYQNGNIVPATGNQQGPANGQGGLQTPGIVPPMPTGTPPNPGGPTDSNPTVFPGGRSLGGDVPPAIDIGQAQPGQLGSAMVTDYYRPPGVGGANGAGDGPGPSSFNLPGFKPAGGVGVSLPPNVQSIQGGSPLPGSDPNAMRQALGTGAMMNMIAKTPDVATSPLGVSPGSVDALPPGFGQMPPRPAPGPAGVGGAAPPPRGVRSPGAGGAGTPWAPPGSSGGFQLRGFKPKPRGPMNGAPTEERQPGSGRAGGPDTAPSKVDPRYRRNPQQDF